MSYRQFETGNNLLYPPELWDFLGVSTSAELLRYDQQKLLGRRSSWKLDSTPTFYDLVEESNPTEAAWMMQETGVLGVRPPWTASDVAQWWTDAADEESIDHLWMAFQLAEIEGVHVELTPAAVSVINEARTSGEMLPLALAGDIAKKFPLATFIRGRVPARQLRQPRDAAVLVYREVSEGHVTLSHVSPSLLATAWQAAREDDWARTYMIRAAVACGDAKGARRAAATFDGRRLLSKGRVREAALFQGTLGSTFRMLQWRQLAGGRILESSTREKILAETRREIHTDMDHELAGTSILVLLKASPPSQPEKDSLIARSMASKVPSQGSLSIEQAVAWADYARYATALGSQLRSPDLSPQAVSQWTTEADDVVAPSIIRYLRALDETGRPTLTVSTQPLVDKLRHLFLNHNAAALDSLSLFGGALVLHAATGAWPYSEDVLLAEIDARHGGCLGGFPDFTRETRAVRSYCSTESSSYAVLVSRALNANEG